MYPAHAGLDIHKMILKTQEGYMQMVEEIVKQVHRSFAETDLYHTLQRWAFRKSRMGERDQQIGNNWIELSPWITIYIGYIKYT